MKSKILAAVLAILMIFSSSIIFAEGNDEVSQGNGEMYGDQLQTQEQTQNRYMNQTCIDEEEQIKERTRLRDRLRITDPNQELHEQRRLQLQNELCFNDIESHWGKDTVTGVYSWGIVNGYPDGTFKPDNNINGTESVLMISRMMNCTDGTAPVETGTGIDPNRVQEWARELMQEQWAHSIAVNKPYYGEEFTSRLRFAEMLAFALGIKDVEVPEGTVVFLDQDEIPAEDLGYIHTLRTLGIIQGYNGNFNPGQHVTRAEAAAMFMRVLDMIE